MARFKASDISAADWPGFAARALWRLDAPRPPMLTYDPPPDRGLAPLYEDEACLALSKPAGLLAVDGVGAGKQDSLSSRVKRRFPFSRAVHRLDLDTSGIMLFAKGREALSALQKQFAQRQTEKLYAALIMATPERESGEIDAPLIADWPNRPRQMLHPEGRPARTLWRLSERRGAQSLLHLTPITGRSHQLRAHLASLGWPILGDPIYGGASAPRLMLHAQALTFASPAAGRIEITDPPPFRDAIRAG